ncbi:uncharacterized protein K02A2.6-like [Eupeodes corollae]|uniref:uncharacterized protein K02A2.6-like n=1 Tax=Eupeodes corollae TaxID=290404 RepID=UPI002492A422|nr:uncharacterized protein K02A2.6-like [Eupeodes corollae]
MEAAELKELLRQQENFLKSLMISQREWMEKVTKPGMVMDGLGRLASNTPAPPPFHQYQKEKHHWESYLKQLEQHFSAYSVEEDQQKRAFLLSWVGSEIFELAQKLLGDKLEDLSFKVITDKLSEHFKRNVHILAARYEFFQAKMGEGQSYADWVAELRGSSRNCKYICSKPECKQEFVDELLRDTIVINTPHDAVRTAALQKPNPTLEDVLLIAESYEATKNTVSVLKNVKGQSTQQQEIFRIDANKTRKNRPMSEGRGKSSGQITEPIKSCPRCGVSHNRDSCKFRNADCYSCNGTGHIASVCLTGSRNKKRNKHSYRRNRSRNRQSVNGSKKMENIETMDSHMIDFINVVDLDNQSETAHDTNVLQSQPVRKGNKMILKLKINDRFMDFLVDTGASCSMVSREQFRQLQCNQLQPAGIVLKAYGDITVPVLGKAFVNVEYDSIKMVLPLIVTDVKAANNILGIDWLDSFGLNMKQEVVYNISNVTLKSKVNDLCNEFSSIFDKSLGRCIPFKAHLQLKSKASPKFFRSRPIPFSQMDSFKQEVERLVSEGIWKPIKFSNWAAPVVVVPKSDGRVRICGDFKALNAQLEVEHALIPRVEEMLYKVRGGKFFAKIDLSDAYLQVELDDESKEFMVVNTVMGLYQCQRLPFGVASAPAIFQRLVEQVIAGVRQCGNYIDDIIVAAETTHELLDTLREIFERLKSYGLVCKREKCILLETEIEFLGHIISETGIRPSDSKVIAIKELPRPTNVKDVQAFMGKVNYYNKFIKNLSQISAPLNILRRNDTAFVWRKEQESAFQYLKSQLVDATRLSHFRDDLPIILATDASKTLNIHQKRYSQIEKEALSIIYGVQKFNQYLYGRHFILYTDHKPLVSIFNPEKNLPVFTAQRLQRWALFLMGYQYSIRYKPTSKHGNADALSRLPMGQDEQFDASENSCLHVQFDEVIEAFPVDAKQIASATAVDPVLSKVLKFLRHGWPDSSKLIDKQLKPYFDRRYSLLIENNIILLQAEHVRVVVPASQQPNVLKLLHDGHWGITRMKQLSRRYCWWPFIDKAITERAAKCIQCQETSSSPRKEYSSWPSPDHAWQRIHLDFAGPFLGHMWLVCIDAFSKFPFVVKMSTTTSSATISILKGIFALEGLPDTIVSDNGRQFVSHEFEQFCSSNGIQHLTSAPFHPASNGEAERFVRTFKTSLKKIMEGGEDLNNALLHHLSTFRSTPNPVTGKSPAEILHGRQPKIPLALMFPRQNKLQSSKGLNRFVSEQLVLVKNFSRGPKWIRGRVKKQLGRMTYLVSTVFGALKRHQNQMRAQHSNENHLDEFFMNKGLQSSAANQASINSDNTNIPSVSSTVSKIVPETRDNNAAAKPSVIPAVQTPRRSYRQRRPVVRFQVSH